MADAHTSRLCVQILENHFGTLVASVGSALLTRGRLPLSALIRLTSLKPQSVRAAVLILVQHNILWHARTEEDGEVLEFNSEECLTRMRFGRLVGQSEELFGRMGSEIVQLILDHGKLRAPEILSQLVHGGQKEQAKYSQVLHKLVSLSYLRPSTVSTHLSPRDKRIKYEEEEKAKISGFPTAKELREAKETADARIRREEEQEAKIGLKRKSKEQPVKRPSKRKAIFMDDDDDDEPTSTIDDTVFFRVNYDKFNIHTRNKLIERAAKERFNEGAAMVMRAALKVTEKSQKHLGETTTEPISVANIAMQLTDEELSPWLMYESSKKSSNMTCIKDFLAMLSCADNPSPAGRAASFVTFESAKVQVNFEIVTRRLKQRVLENITRERHGSEGVRIVRLLLEKGKMDEKQISKIVMMAAKDVRSVLMALNSDSIVSTAEVPRSADRNPTRTFYLWHVDLAKVYSVISGNLYKTLYNISMRRQAEREDPMVKAVLEKRERTDISEDESLLSTLDQSILSDWKTKERKLTVLEMRVDDSLFILKDLGVLSLQED